MEELAGPSERNPGREGLTGMAWEYRWSSAAAYVEAEKDGVTDENPYLGTLDNPDDIQGIDHPVLPGDVR